jgi:predicted translin family RNA/ssDNA-binding protein
MLTTFLDLASGLIKDGHPDLALKVLHKYDGEMPDINPGLEVADRKIFMAKTAYQLHDAILGKKFVTSVDDYVTDQLDYNYNLMKNNSGDFSPQTVQYCISFISGLADVTGENHQIALNNKLKAQMKDYETKFAAILQRGQ